MLLEALFKLIGWLLFPSGIAIVLFAWLGYFGMGVDAGIQWLVFLNGSLAWAIILTLIGGFVTALSLVMARQR